MFFLTLVFSEVLFSQQITTNTNQTLDQLVVNNFDAPCIEISNISSQVNGSFVSVDSYGSFDRAGSNFPFQSGIFLTTGNANDAGNGLNTAPLSVGNSNWGTDLDLENSLGITNTLNATSIQFDFSSAGDIVQFRYLLASEEYQQNYPCLYSDGFAFLIRESGTTAPFTNIALVPGTSIPVNTNTVHDEIAGFCPAENETYFDGYNIGDTNYNGRTTILTASANIIPNTTYTIKLIIADQGDSSFDSAVFIESNSFDTTVDLGPDLVLCESSVLLDSGISLSTASFQWFLDGSLIPGETNSTINATASGLYRVEVSLQTVSGNCIIEDEIQVTVNFIDSITSPPDLIICDEVNFDGISTFDLTENNFDILSNIPNSSYNITFYETLTDAENNINQIPNVYTNTVNNQTIYVRIEDTSGNCSNYITSFNLVVLDSFGNINLPPITIEFCDLEDTDGITLIDFTDTSNNITNGDPNIIVSYHTSQSDADNGLNPLPNPYMNSNANETIYVRIFDIGNNCFITTTININVLPTVILNQDFIWLNACEINNPDGFEIFDLTSVINEITLGAPNITVTFHESQADADTGTNPISNPSSYQNTIPEFQLIFIRVVDNNSGCASVRSFELHTNVALTGYQDLFTICDDISNDGIEIVSFAEIIDFVLNRYADGENFVFYPTDNDRQNNTNPYSGNDIQITDGTILYATISNMSCIQPFDIEFEIYQIYQLNPVSVFYCDEDQDGFTAVNMSSFDATVAQGTPFSSVNYYLTLSDAENQLNPLPTIYNNISNPEILFTNVTSSDGCPSVTQVTLNINPAPVVSQPSDIIICDDDLDGLFVINLNDKIPEVVSSTSDRTITFHNTLVDAESNNNPINNTSTYQTSTTTVYVRVEITSTGCFEILDFEVIINTLPDFPIPITNFISCETIDSNTSDYLLQDKDLEILNGQTGKVVSYHLTANDADLNLNPIDKTIPFQNTVNPQTIYVRVENITDPNCYGTSSFILNVEIEPIFNDPIDIFTCDDISYDFVETIDLNDVINQMSSGSPDPLNFSFHLNQNDAENGINTQPLLFTNTVNPQTIYVRVDKGGVCYEVRPFNINILSVPQVNPISSIVVCDDNYDGISVFDLDNAVADFINVRPNDNFTIAFFETLMDAETDSNPITNLNAYNNLTPFQQTIYFKATNNDTNCPVIVPFDLIVNLPPEIIDFQNFQFCDNDSNSIDLTLINQNIVASLTDINITYHASQADADNDITLPNIFTYSSIFTNLVAKVSFISTGCATTYPFTIEAIDIVINPLQDIYLCDDISADGVESYDLSLQDSDVFGNYDPNTHTITYHNSQADAELGINALPTTLNNISDNSEVFVRLENLLGCFETSSFFIFINPYPTNPILFTECDVNTDGIFDFNLNDINSQIFDTTNPDNSITYFASLDNYNANIAIFNPSNYQNISNPQTIYAVVENSLFGCSELISFDISVDVPPIFNNISSVDYCETENNVYDLTLINDFLINNSTLYTFQYYETMQDAENQTNELGTTYTYTGNIQIYIRVTDIATGCHSIDTLVLNIIPLPPINTPPDMEECDDDFDGFASFDLTSQNIIVFGNLDPSLYVINYYTNELNATTGFNPIDSPSSYLGQDGQTLYVRVEEIASGCFSIESFQLIVHRKPMVDIPQQTICLDNLPLVVSAETGFSSDTYLWSTNENTSEIEINTIGTYSVTVTTAEGCVTTSTFDVIESEAAMIDFVETIDFSDPNNITITVSGVGDYLYQLDGGTPQISNVFTNVSMGYHTITIIDINGCASVSRQVLVIDYPRFFTPNGDTYNDTWHIIGIETLPGSTVIVFDRFGKVMAVLSHDSDGWDGKYNGFNKPATDYWFTATIVVPGENSFEVQGHFALKR